MVWVIISLGEGAGRIYVVETILDYFLKSIKGETAFSWMHLSSYEVIFFQLIWIELSASQALFS